MGTHYLWDDVSDNVVAEYDDEGNTIAQYTTEPTLYGNVISQHRNGQSRFFHYDGTGNTIAVTDNAATVTDTRAYTAFGEITESTGSTDFPFQFVGQKGYYRDKETGEYSVRRRPYGPVIARWKTVDPMGYLRFINYFIYVLNSPLFSSDPSGMIPKRDENPATVEVCETCVLLAMTEGEDEIIKRLIRQLTIPQGEKRDWKKECEPKIKCCHCDKADAEIDECKLCPNPRQSGALVKGTQKIGLCSINFGDYRNEPIPGSVDEKYSLCADVWETLRHELIHLRDQCTKHNRNADKCIECLCDELRAHKYAKQCEKTSIFYLLNRQRFDVDGSHNEENCLLLGSAESCISHCEGLFALNDSRRKTFVRDKTDDFDECPPFPDS